MDLKDLLIKEFACLVESLRDDYLDRIIKRLELEFKKKKGKGLKEIDGDMIPLKRGVSPPKDKARKFMKLSKIREDGGKKEDRIEKKNSIEGKEQLKMKNNDRLCKTGERKNEDVLRNCEKKIEKYLQGPDKYREKEDMILDLQINQKIENFIRKAEKNDDSFIPKIDTHYIEPKIIKNEYHVRSEKVPEYLKYYEKKDQNFSGKRFEDHKPELKLKNAENSKTQLKTPDLTPEKSPTKFSQASVSKKIFPRIENTEISIKKALDELKFCPIDRTSEILNTFLTLLEEPKSRIIDHFTRLNGEKALKDLTNRESISELKDKYTLLLLTLEKKTKEIHGEKKLEGWFDLFKNLQEAEYKKNDKDLLIIFDKISEFVSNRRVNGSDMVYIDKSLKIIGNIAKDWRKNDIKNYASVVLKKCNEHLQRQENIEKAHINDRLKNFIPI